MTKVAEKGATTQVYRVYIKASPQQIWDAITRPEWNRRYAFGTPIEYDLRKGGAYRATASEQMQQAGAPPVIFEGEVLEALAPSRLVHTQKAVWEANEPASTVTYEIVEGRPGVAVLTVTHDLEGAPNHAAMVAGETEEGGGGWPEVLSDLKSLVETGEPLYG